MTMVVGDAASFCVVVVGNHLHLRADGVEPVHVVERGVDIPVARCRHVVSVHRLDAYVGVVERRVGRHVRR